MTTTDRRRTFDEVADQYERFRPGYPEALVDDVAWLADLPAGGRILEIGSGTGKATVAFAARGYRMTCIELGPHLAAIARRKLLPYPQVEVEVTAFEDWPAPAAAFDLVMAAQCFHFLDAGPALHAIAATLRPGGALAIFGNSERRCDPQIDRAVNEAYRRFGPAADATPGLPLEDVIDVCGRFATVVKARYRWPWVYGAEEYVSLTETYSPQRVLAPERRSQLLAALHQAVGRGSVAVEYVTRLHLARRRS